MSEEKKIDSDQGIKLELKVEGKKNSNIMKVKEIPFSNNKKTKKVANGRNDKCSNIQVEKNQGFDIKNTIRSIYYNENNNKILDNGSFKEDKIVNSEIKIKEINSNIKFNEAMKNDEESLESNIKNYISNFSSTKSVQRVKIDCNYEIKFNKIDQNMLKENSKIKSNEKDISKNSKSKINNDKKIIESVNNKKLKKRCVSLTEIFGVDYVKRYLSHNLKQDVNIPINYPKSKPRLSYTDIIKTIFYENQNNKTSLIDLYTAIQIRFPYFQTYDSWKNSIRHSLSINKIFIKVPRNDNKPGKGGYWILDNDAYEKLKYEYKNNEKKCGLCFIL